MAAASRSDGELAFGRVAGLLDRRGGRDVTAVAPMLEAEPFSVCASVATAAGSPLRIRASSSSACRSNNCKHLAFETAVA